MASRRTYPIPNKNLSGSDYIQNKRAKQLFSGTSNLAKTIEQQNGNFPLVTPLGKLKPYQGTFGLSGRYDTYTSPNDKTYCLNTSHSYRDLLAITKGKYLLTPPNVADQSTIKLQDVNDPTKLYNGIYYVYIYFNTTNALYYMNPPYPDPSGNYIPNKINYDVTGNANERIIIDPSFILNYASQSCILRPKLSQNIGINNDFESRYSFNRTINLDLFSGFQYPIKFSLDYDTGDCINASNDLQSKYAFPIIPQPEEVVLYTTGGNYNSNIPNAVLSYSNDGVTWIPSTNGSSILTTSVNDIKINSNNLWLATGSGSSSIAAYSTDGITWVGTSLSSVLSIGNGICWSSTSSRWIVVGQTRLATDPSGTSIAYSSNLTSWSHGVGIGSNYNPFGLDGIGNSVAENAASTPPKIIAVGSSTLSPTRCMVVSDTGVIWLTFSSAPLYTPSNPAYSIHHSLSTLYPSPNGLWIVGGKAFLPITPSPPPLYPLYYSTDNGATWTPGTNTYGALVSEGICYDIGWNGYYYVAVGSNILGLSSIVYSYDGKIWGQSANGSSFSGSVRKITWQSVLQRWVAVSSQDSSASGFPYVGFSADGDIWNFSGNGSTLLENGGLSVRSSTDKN